MTSAIACAIKDVALLRDRRVAAPVAALIGEAAILIAGVHLPTGAATAITGALVLIGTGVNALEKHKAQKPVAPPMSPIEKTNG